MGFVAELDPRCSKVKSLSVGADSGFLSTELFDELAVETGRRVTQPSWRAAQQGSKANTWHGEVDNVVLPKCASNGARTSSSSQEGLAGMLRLASKRDIEQGKACLLIGSFISTLNCHLKAFQITRKSFFQISYLKVDQKTFTPLFMSS